MTSPMSVEDALETLSAMANVQEGYAKKATDRGLKIIHKANAKAQREVSVTLTTLAAENATLRHDRDVAVINNDVLRIAMDTLRAERDELKSAMAPTPDAELDAFVDFMCGAGEFDGAWFGGAHHSLSGHFWWRTRLRKTIATLRASEAAALERAEKAEAVVAKLLAADKLRDAYHAKPNDHNRIGDKKSPKHIAKTHWLRAFNRAVASAKALTPTADKEPKT